MKHSCAAVRICVATLLAGSVLMAGGPVHAASAKPEVSGLQEVLLRLQTGQPAKDALENLKDAGRLQGLASPSANGAAQDGRQLEQASTALAAGLAQFRDHQLDLPRLTNLYEAWRAAAQVAELKLQSQGAVLKNATAGAAYVSRHAEVQGKVVAAFAQVRDTLDPVLDPLRLKQAPASDAQRLRAVSAAIDLLAHAKRPADNSHVLRAQVVPFGGLSLAPRKPVTSPVVVPSYESKTEIAPADADRQATKQAPLSDEVIQQATALGNDYVRIYEFVHNTIRNEWYAGAVKGAVGTLRSGAGNDVDQASLLTALLRAAGLSTHYVQGVVELPLSRVATDLGLPADQAAQVPNALQKAGVAYAPIVKGGQIAAVQVQRVWVSAYVPYTNYRGALVDGSGKAWIPLDPFYKTVQLQPSTGFFTKNLKASALTANYEAQAFAQPFADFVRQQVQSTLTTKGSSADWSTQKSSLAIQPLQLDILPNSLPYAVVATTLESADLPSDVQGQVRIRLHAGTGANDPVVLDQTLPLADAVNARLTLSYGPASVQDHRVALLYGGMDAVPLYLIGLRPQLRLGGDVAAQGTDKVSPGTDLRLDVDLTGPWGMQQINQVVLAGAYQALVLGNDPYRTSATASSDEEHLGAKLLDGLGVYYASQWNAADTDLAALSDTGVVRPLPALTLVSTTLRSTYLNDVPFTLEWTGVSIDAALRPVDAVGASARDFLSLSALAGSSYERTVFMDQFKVKAVSADAGIQAVAQQGQPVLTLSGNTSALAGTSHPDAVKQAVGDLVQQGFTVSIPAAPLQVEAWSGSVWQATSADGRAGYFIAGGLAGGETAIPPDQWPLAFLADALKGMDSDAPNNDPRSGVSVAKVGAGEGQEGVAGKPLAQPLAVIVKDVNGLPVAGAQVTFAVVGGDANFGAGGASVTVPTDAQGMASVSVTLGKSTFVDSVWVMRNASDEWATQAGAITVDVGVDSALGVLRPSSPFSALMFPDVMSDLKRDSPAVTSTVQAGIGADVLALLAVDRFGNPIPNVGIQASIDSQPACPLQGIGTFQPGAVYNAQVSAHACDASGPILGQCGSASLSLKSDSNGRAFAGVIASNALAGTNTVNVNANGIGKSFSYTNGGSCIAPRQSPAQYGMLMTYGGEYDGAGNAVAAVKPGAIYDKPFTTGLFRSNYPYRIDSDGYAIYESLLTWVPTTGSVTSVSISPSGMGLVSSNSFKILTGSAPAKYTATVSANVDVVEYIRSLGEVTSTVSVSGPGGAAYAVVPTITGVQSLGVPANLDPSKIYLDGDGISYYPLQVQYKIDPADYQSTINPWVAALLTDGAWSAYATGDSPAKNGNAVLPRALSFQPQQHNYQVQLTNQKVESDKFTLPLRQKLISSISGGTSASRYVDPVNQRVCDVTGSVGFVVTQDVLATATYQALDEQGNPTGNPQEFFSNKSFAQGPNSFDVDASKLGTGDFQILLKAQAVSDASITDEAGSGASVLYQFLNSLPVGQTLVKGVNARNGILTFQTPRLELPGRGAPLGFMASYSSNGVGRLSTVGANWTHNYDLGLQVNSCGQVMVAAGDSGTVSFFPNAEGKMVPDRGYHGTLEANHSDNSWDFYSKDGTKYHYKFQNKRVQWRIDRITDRNGNWQQFSYDDTAFPDPLLMSITSSDGRSLTFTYVKKTLQGSHPGTNIAIPVSLLTQVIGTGDTSVSLDYDDLGNLTSYAVNGRNNTFTYTVSAAMPPERYRLASASNPKGATTTYGYATQKFVMTGAGAQGSLTVSMDLYSVAHLVTPLGASYDFSYDSGSWSSSTVSASPGATTSYAFDKFGRTLSISDSAGATTMTWADDDVLMTSRTDPNGNTTSYTYDSQGNVTSESIGGTTASYTYELQSSPPYRKSIMTSRTDRNGQSYVFSLDGSGNVVGERLPVGTVTHAYASNGDLLSTTDANGHTTRFEYDSFGNNTAVVHANGARIATPRDARGRVTSSSDGNGNTTVFAYDGQDNLVGQTNGAGGQRTMSYDAVGNKLSETDEGGRTTTWDYNAANQPTSMKLSGPGGSASKAISYDAAGNKKTETDWNGNLTAYAYDAVNRLTQRTEPLGKITTFGYDGNGNLLTETTGDRTTSHTYDALNRRVTTIDAEGKNWKFAYDGNGNRTSTTDPLGRKTDMVYDGMNRLTAVNQPMGRSTQFGYDPVGNKTSETDPNGNQTSYVYDNVNRLTSKKQPDGTTVSFSYDNADNLTQQIDAGGGIWTYSYDSLNRKKTAKDPEGGVTANDYDALSNLIHETAPNGNAVAHTYDLFNRRTSTTDSMGLVHSWTYDGNGNLLEETDGLGHKTSYTYNELNQRKQASLPGGRPLTFAPDLFGNVLESVDARGNKTKYTYDKLDHVKSVTYADGGATTVTYDDAGNKVAETDPLGHPTTYVVDALNRVSEIKDALGNKVSMTYDAVGNVRTKTDKRGTVTEIAYDTMNRPLTTTKAGVAIDTLTYNALGQVASSTDANGNTTSHTYDRRGLVVLDKAPEGANTQYQRDVMGDVTQLTDPEGRVTKSVYDMRRRVTSVTDAAGAATQYTYDLNDKKLTVTRPSGAVTTYTYDERDMLVGVAEPLGRNSQYERDANGNLTKFTDAAGNAVSYGYDKRDRRNLITYAGGAAESFTYDAAGNVKQHIDGNGVSVARTFDDLNRETNKTYSSSTDGLTGIATTYDANGNVLTVTQSYSSGPTRVSTYTYDAFDRQQTAQDAFGGQIVYSYDLNGNRKTLATQDGKLTRYNYDGLNRLSSLSSAAGSVQYGYDRSGLVLQQTWSNGDITNTVYDAAKRATSITLLHGSTPLNVTQYSYDVNGNRKQERVNRPGGAQVTTYDYDAADRLTATHLSDGAHTTDSAWTYDGADNRLTETISGPSGNVSRSFTYNARNELTHIDDSQLGAVTLTYDAEGNLQQKQVGGDTTTYVWNARDYLVQVSRNGTVLGRYSTDYTGMRVSKEALDPIHPGAPPALVTTQWDDNNAVQDRDSTGNVVARYDFANGQPVAMWNPTDGNQMLHADALGSIVATTAADGTLKSETLYDAWGNPLVQEGESANKFAYTGQQADRETGLYYYKARYYDPQTGRFISQDPAEGDDERPESYQKYLYAYANPTVYVDRDGRFAGTVTGAVAGFFWGAGQMAVGMIDDIRKNKTRSTWQYLGVWGQNIVGGAEIGASFDVAVVTGGLGIAGSGALAGAGMNALTLRGQGDSLKDFAKGQVEGAVTGAIGGVVLSKLAPVAVKVGGVVLDKVLPEAVKETATTVAAKAAEKVAGLVDAAASRYAKTETATTIANAAEALQKVVTREGTTIETEAAAPVVQKSVAAQTSHEVQAATTELPKGAARGAATEATPEISRRDYLNAKFGRSGNLDADINARGVVDSIRQNARQAASMTRADQAAGTISSGPQAFGTRAHAHFESLNQRLETKVAGTYRITTEQFRDAAGAIQPRRSAGTVGADVLVEKWNTPGFIHNFDLKTYGTNRIPIGPSRQAQFRSRFGITAEEIFEQR